MVARGGAGIPSIADHKWGGRATTPVHKINAHKKRKQNKKQNKKIILHLAIQVDKIYVLIWIYHVNDKLI